MLWIPTPRQYSHRVIVTPPYIPHHRSHPEYLVSYRRRYHYYTSYYSRSAQGTKKILN